MAPQGATDWSWSEPARCCERSERESVGGSGDAQQSEASEIFAMVVMNLLIGSALRYKELTAKETSTEE
jgi:hypothetical protein